VEAPMAIQRLFDQINEAMPDVIARNTELGIDLWEELIKLHPADIAQFLSSIKRYDAQQLFNTFPDPIKLEVFEEITDSLKLYCLSSLDDKARGHLLSYLPVDELTDFLDDLPDEDLKQYLKVLHKSDRDQVLSLLQFNPESAGGIMDTNVLTLLQDFTVGKSIQILQRIQPDKELHHQIFITNQDNELKGHINIEDLVLKSPDTRIASIMKPNELIVHADEDREDVVQKMMHYHLTTVPVVSKENIFLGVIPSDTLAEVIEEEASEDIYRMSALAPIKHTYFETPFFKLLYQRCSILLILLVLQTFSTIIIQMYEVMLAGFFMRFITMLTSTGGNSGSQTSALAIQGMASGEINAANVKRFIRREFFMALLIAIILGVFSLARIFFTHGFTLDGIAVSLSLAAIVLVSIMLGSTMPLLLKKLNMDPAHSAGPVLATLMDVIGLLLYCFICQLLLQ